MRLDFAHDVGLAGSLDGHGFDVSISLHQPEDQHLACSTSATSTLPPTTKGRLVTFHFASERFAQMLRGRAARTKYSVEALTGLRADAALKPLAVDRNAQNEQSKQLSFRCRFQSHRIPRRSPAKPLPAMTAF